MVVRAFAALRAFFDVPPEECGAEPLFEPTESMLGASVGEILAGAGIAAYGILWFFIVLGISVQ